jgi:hypothetical protein
MIMNLYYFTAFIFSLQYLHVESGSCKSNNDCGLKESCATLFGFCSRLSCRYDNDCFSNEFCNLPTRRRIGECAAKTPDGTFCVVNIE